MSEVQTDLLSESEKQTLAAISPYLRWEEYHNLSTQEISRLCFVRWLYQHGILDG